MATFLQGVTDTFAPMELYKPDYGFLTQVYGTKQAQYDRGFNAVKSFYTSVLNDAVTNKGNEQFRKDAFKKLQHSLKTVANADLSNTANVQKALSLVDPITDDKDLAYDMAVTKFHAKQKQIMENYRNSSDPEKRAMYNDYNKINMQHAEEDLANAVRGDGSIQNIQPAEFVPFEDINEYLNKQAKEQGLKIQTSGPDGKGYIITDTNGDAAIMPFAEWAAQQMSGGRFDRQLALMGKVQAETAIRTKMKNEELSRSDAINSIAGTIAPEVSEKRSLEGANLQENLDNINKEIALFDKHYANGIPASQAHLKDRYDMLQEQKKLHEGKIQNVSDEVNRIKDEGAEYIASNLYNTYTQEAKEKTALLWGATRAQATAERELKTDGAWVAKMNNATKIAIHRDNQRWKAMDYKLKIADHQLKKEELAWKLANKAGTGTGSGTGKGKKGELPYEHHLGIFTSLQTGTAADVLDDRMRENRNKMFRGVTKAGDGLMNLVVEPKDYNKTVRAINKLKQIADGSGGTLTGEEQQILKQYGELIGYDHFKPENFSDVKTANSALEAITIGTYQTAQEVLPVYAKAGFLPEYIKSVKPFQETFNALKSVNSVRGTVDESMKQVVELMHDAEGKLRDQFEGATIIGKRPDGTPIFDLSGMSKEAKLTVDQVIAQDFNKLKIPTGNVYSFHNLQPAETFALFNENIAQAFDEDGDPVDIEEIAGNLGSLPHSAQSELFGESLEVAYDVQAEVAKITLKVDPNSGTAKKLKMDQVGTLQLEIPYGTILANQQSLGRFSKYLYNNQASSEVAGQFSDFQSDPYARIQSPVYVDKLGFEYDIAGVNFTDKDGQDKYGMNVWTSYYDPILKDRVENMQTFPVANPSDPATLNKMEVKAEEWINNYLISLGDYRRQAMADPNKIPLNTPITVE